MIQGLLTTAWVQYLLYMYLGMPNIHRFTTEQKRTSRFNRLSSGSKSPLVDSPTTPQRTINNLRNLIESNPAKNMTRSKQTSTSTTRLLPDDSEDDSFMVPDKELIKRATKSKSKTNASQNIGQLARSSDPDRLQTTKTVAAIRNVKDLSALNEFGKLLKNQTKELMTTTNA